MISLNVGDVVAIKYWWGEHWGIVGMRDGRGTLISNRAIKGKVTEDPLEDFTDSSQWRIVSLAGQFSASAVVARARSKIGSRYDFWKWNCQDLVHWAHGLKQQSPDREAVTATLVIASLAMMIAAIAKKA